MTTENKEARYRKLVADYLNTKHSDEVGDLVMNCFGAWFNEDSDRELKDRLMNELSDQVSIDNTFVLTEEKLERCKELVLARIHALENDNYEKHNNDDETPDSKKNRLFVPIWARIAAVVIPFIVIASVWMFNQNSDQPIVDTQTVASVVVNEIDELTVEYADRKELTLEDGTQMWVNSGSRISYPKNIDKNSTERVVELEGESYFKVAPNEEKPFIVKTDRLSVTVLGTEFNVKAYPESDSTVVTLSSGKVNIKTIAGLTYTLEPNQQLKYIHSTGVGTVTNLLPEEIHEATLWKDGVLTFTDMQIKDVLKSLERRFNVEIEMVGVSDIERRVITAKFAKTESLDQVLEVLKTVIPNFEYKIENNRLFITAQ